jgi:hypothetical protein
MSIKVDMGSFFRGAALERGRLEVRETLESGQVVELVIETGDGRARATEVRVFENPEELGGVTGLVIDDVPIERLIHHAIARLRGFVFPPENEAQAVEAAAEIRASTRRRRTPLERLERVAALYAEGGAKRVQDGLPVSERHAWRLVKQARDEGLIEKGRRG